MSAESSQRKSFQEKTHSSSSTIGRNKRFRKNFQLISREQVKKKFKGKTVAIVGSAPSVLENEPGFIDSHDIVVRVNNYKLSDATGTRVDVHYSFYGSSIRKTDKELYNDGVWLCMCKCPNSQPFFSRWHAQRGKLGTDFTYIYKNRRDFWFTDTYIPSDDLFLKYFNILDKHVPTTGIQCIMEVLSFDCEKVYITGFDFFQSGIHNVDEKWRPGNPKDPIGHRTDLELKWMKENRHRFEADGRLDVLL